MADAEGLGGPREGSDFQNLHRNKRSITLNLKSPEGVAVLKKLAAKADVVVENYRPDVKKRLGIDYEALSAVNPRLIYASISGFGQDGPYAEPAGLRPDRARHGRADVDHRPARAGPGARRHSGRGPDRRAVRRDGHHGGAARARELRQGPVDRHLAAAGADLHAGFPGDALADRRRSRRRRPATTIRPRSRPACSRPPTATSTSRPPGRRCGSGCARRSASPDAAKHPDYATGAARSKNRDALNAVIEKRNRQEHQRALGRAPSTRPACRADRSIRSTRPSPTSR